MEAEKRGHKLNFATASRYLRGDHPAKPSAQVLAAFAAVFGTDVNRIREAAGQAPTADRFELPPEADMLNPDERRAVTELVRVMARQKRAGDGSERSATPTKRAGVSPAPKAGPTAAELEDADRRQSEADETPLSEILGLAADTGESDAERRAREEGKQQ